MQVKRLFDPRVLLCFRQWMSSPFIFSPTCVRNLSSTFFPCEHHKSAQKDNMLQHGPVFFPSSKRFSPVSIYRSMKYAIFRAGCVSRNRNHKLDQNFHHSYIFARLVRGNLIRRCFFSYPVLLCRAGKVRDTVYILYLQMSAKNEYT